MKAFRISFVAPAPKLSAIIGAIENEVLDLDIKQIEVPAGGARHSPRPPMKRLPGGLEAAVLLKVKVHQTYSMEQIREIVRAAGGSENSASPLMSQLVRDGRAERTAAKTFKILPSAKS